MRRNFRHGTEFSAVHARSEAAAHRNGVVFLLFWLLEAFNGTRCSRRGPTPSGTGRLRGVARRSLAADHVCLPALWDPASAVQHAGAVDVRRATRSGLGYNLFSSFIFSRDWGGADYRSGFVHRMLGFAADADGGASGGIMGCCWLSECCTAIPK